MFFEPCVCVCVLWHCRYSAILSGFVYPCVVHWTWSNDAWLADGSGPRGGGEGYKDFAGSGVVHITGGTAALIGALSVGPRAAVKGMSYTHKRLVMAHSIPLASLGTTILKCPKNPKMRIVHPCSCTWYYTCM